MKYMLLGSEGRAKVRRIARLAFGAAAGNPEKAKQYAEAELRAVYRSGLQSLLVSIAISLAFKLILYWIEQNYFSSDVPEHYQSGEPGAAF